MRSSLKENKFVCQLQGQLARQPILRMRSRYGGTAPPPPPPSISVANWPKVQPYHLKESSKKVSGRTYPRPNWGQVFPERAEKGPKFETVLLPLPLPYE